MSIAPGTDFASDYQIVEQIGHSSMGAVFKAHQPSMARYVALKILPHAVTSTEDAGERFLQQAALLARLHHMAILELYAYGIEQGTAYLVTELIEHLALEAQVGAPLSSDFVQKVLAPIAAALDYAHEDGIIHRNIKPSNILLSRDGRPVLQDLGLASLVQGSSDHAAKQTTFGLPVGTPAYMAPEFAAGQQIGPAADRYSLAVVAYEMLTGRVPFTGDTPMAVMLDHLRQPVPRPSTINPAIKPEAEEVLLRGLAKEPEQRYASAAGFIADLYAASRPGTVPVREAPEAPTEDTVRRPDRIEERPRAMPRQPARVEPRRDTGLQSRLGWLVSKGLGEMRARLVKPLLRYTEGLRVRLTWLAYRLGKRTGLPLLLVLAIPAVVVVGGIVLLISR